MDADRSVLDRRARGPATLADLRAALPEDHAERRALPSMGERDPFGHAVAALVEAGRVREAEGRYSLP